MFFFRNEQSCLLAYIISIHFTKKSPLHFCHSSIRSGPCLVSDQFAFVLGKVCAIPTFCNIQLTVSTAFNFRAVQALINIYYNDCLNKWSNGHGRSGPQQVQGKEADRREQQHRLRRQPRRRRASLRGRVRARHAQRDEASIIAMMMSQNLFLLEKTHNTSAFAA